MIRIWSKKIVQVIQKYDSSKNSIFAITGDIDNLGIFVSQRGRPMAENLVDIYNRIIGATIKHYIDQYTSITDFAFIPSGEEIFAIGVCSDDDMVHNFFSFIKNDINSIIKKDCIIDAPDVSISFGYKILNDINFNELLLHIDNGDIKSANISYLQIMKKIREELAVELDKSKFSSLSCSETVFLRNCVYAKMREYKQNTKSSLIKISQFIKDDNNFIENNFFADTRKQYGVDDEHMQKILDIVNNE